MIIARTQFMENTSALLKKYNKYSATMLINKHTVSYILPEKKTKTISFPEKHTISCSNKTIKKEINDSFLYVNEYPNNNSTITYFYGSEISLNVSRFEKFIKQFYTENIKIGIQLNEVVTETFFWSNVENKYQVLKYYDVDFIFYHQQTNRIIYKHQYTIRNELSTINELFDVEKIHNLVADMENYLSANPINDIDFTNEALLLSPGVAALLAHEVGHFGEEDYFNQNDSIKDNYKKKLCKIDFNLINLSKIDSYASSKFFLDNGVPPKNTYLFKNGYFVGKLTIEDNSHLSIDDEILLPRMSHIMIESGNISFEEMISSIDSGYYLKYPIIGMEHPESFSFELHCLLAQRILKGKLTETFYKDIHLYCNTKTTLSRISAIGNDMSTEHNGYCYKGPIGKSGLKVTKCAPHLLIK